MNVSVIADRELTRGERFAIDRFSHYFNNQRAFAVVGDNTVVVLTEQETHEKIIEISKNAMNSVLNSHPDFNSYIMNDGNVLVEMLYNLYAVADGQEAGILPTDKEAPIGIALATRSYCLAAAENCEVIAIVEPDESII